MPPDSAGMKKRMARIAPASAGKVDTIIMTMKTCIDKISARGGQVIFLRPPSQGPVYTSEMKRFPRQKFWQRVLDETKTPGLHFEDYAGLSQYKCPELSHLSPADAVKFTSALINILHTEQHWKFPNLP
jgi:hypothetical protein